MENRQDIFPLKCCSLALLDFLYLLIYLPFFGSLSPTLDPSCLSAHTGIIKTLSEVHCNGETENERQWERERGAGWGCYVGDTVKRSMMHGTRRPFSRAHFKACFALVLSTFGRGEDRSEGGAAFEQRWVFTHSLSCQCSLSAPHSRYQIAYVLAALPHFLLSPNSNFFYFANVPLSPRLLCLFFCF